MHYELKKILYILTIGFSGVVFSQVRIGDKTINPSNPSLSSSSVLLEFGDTKNKGIILPYVETVPTGVNDAKGGTIIFDISTIAPSTSPEYKIKVKNENAGWTDLSVVSGYSTNVANTVTSVQSSVLEKKDAKVVIGNPATTTDGVLVLDATDKAMVLPIVDDYKAIINPSPGMMAFIKHPTDNKKHKLIVFNGQKWTFWEAQ